MVFAKINSTGWAFEDELTSTQMNIINNDFPNAIDKTGETSAGGGGVSGEIDFKSGSSIVLQSGASLTNSSGATITNASGGTIANNGTITNNSAFNVATGGNITFQSGSTGTIASGSTVTNSGSFVVSSTGTVTLQSGAGITFQSGSTVNVDGIFTQQTRIINANYTLDASGSDVNLLVNTGSGSHTITLPAATVNPGRKITIRDESYFANTSPIVVTSTSTFPNGATSMNLAISRGYWEFTADSVGNIWWTTNAIPARGYTDNASGNALVDTNYHIIATLTVIPAISGKFRVSFTGLPNNASTTTAGSLLFALSAGTGNTTPDYTFSYNGGTGGLNMPGTTPVVSYFACGSVDYDVVVGQYGLTTNVVFNLLAKSTQASTCNIGAHSCQLSVIEVY